MCGLSGYRQFLGCQIRSHHASASNFEGFVGDQFEPGERDIAFALWADDESKRVFTPIPGTTDFYIDLRPQD